jgi:2-amino-4-hydroxy-6-hydroxymethyldihydropteridine diphosphokinase
MKHLAYLALGTNLGDRLENLELARESLSEQVKLLACSPIYETAPWGYLEQPAFLNQVIQVETELTPQALLAALKDIELRMGRQASVRFGPRLIDLDILLYDDLVLDLPELTIPHPRMAGRGFVLVPLADLAPDFQHPVLHQSVRQLLAEADTSGIVPYTGKTRQE